MMVIALTAAQDGDWTAYGRDAGGERFSPLDQIRAGNVGTLTVAWTYHTGDAFTPRDGRPTAFEATPLVTRRHSLPEHAAGQGDRPRPGHRPATLGVRREGAARQGVWRLRQPRRVALAARQRAADHRRYRGRAAVRARRRHRPSDPRVRRERRGRSAARAARAPTGFADYEVTSPPAIVNDIIVVGSGIADGTSKPHPSGEVRGFDALSGRLKWSWDPVPQDPSAIGGGSWAKGSAPHLGGANAWSVIVADPARNLVFVPTSSPSNDYYGGERPGDNLFSDSVVALRADTGERVWHFQTVHHDLWDYDVASPPLLFDWHKDGRTVPAIAIASKTGHLFILDRTTGTPLIPVEERPVPGQRCAGRGGIADAALPDRAEGAGADPVDRGSGLGRDRCRSPMVPRHHPGAALGRAVHPSVAHRHAGDARECRRHGVGRHRARPDQRPADHAGQQPGG